MPPRRVVSLVPSLTEAVAALGHADRLVGVTRYCTLGAPAHAARLRGTKNPSVGEILALEPDLVLANREENRKQEVTALIDAGVAVELSEPRRVDDVGALLAHLADLLGDPTAAEPLVADLDAAREEAAAIRPTEPVPALTLIWRRPWMAVGGGVYVDDLLAACGFANVVGDRPRYPRLTSAAGLDPAVVLLPSEPYVFTEDDHDAVRALVGTAPRLSWVDGRILTWHGPSTAQALRRFAALAASYS